MAQAQTWTGKSGVYQYEVHPVGQEFPAVAGNYIFAKETPPGWWSPIYIGRTANLSERFDGHHKMPCIRANGATHIHIHWNNGDAQMRLDEEADLIAKHNPPCNG